MLNGRLNTARRWKTVLFCVLIVLLGVAVFCTGVAYKLSLYRTADGSSDVPQSRLCVNASEKLLKPFVAASPETMMVVVLPGLLLLMLMRSPLRVFQFDEIRVMDSPLLRANFSHAAFRRPPPVLRSLL